MRWAETAEGFLVDLRVRWGRLCYNPDFEKLKNDFKTGNPQQVSRHGAGAGQQGVGRVQTVLRGFWHGGGHGRLREPLPRLLWRSAQVQKVPVKLLQSSGHKKVPDLCQLQKITHQRAERHVGRKSATLKFIFIW